MENDPLKIAYDAAIDAGYKHVSIAKSSGVSEDSLRQFYKNGSLGRERRAALVPGWCPWIGVFVG